MQIIFYSGFAKKTNSTKRPDNIQTTLTLTGTLKEDCSVINPRIVIQRVMGDVAPQGFTYAYIQAFNRYYFVDDWTWENPFWVCSMHVDPLATWKPQIGQQSMYVLRTDSTMDYGPLITDTLYPASNEFTTIDDEITGDPFRTAFNQGLAGGTYIVGIISGENSDNVGAITYYAMTPYQFGQLKHTLFSDENLVIMDILEEVPGGDPVAKINDMSPELLKSMYNPYQYISSVMWFPFYESSIPASGISSVNSVKLGWWSYPISCSIIKAQVVTFYQYKTLADHPQAQDRGEYLNYSPYTRMHLVGRFGDIPIDPSFFNSSRKDLAIKYDVDLISGQCKASIGSSTAAPLRNIQYYTTREFLLAVPVQIAQISKDYLGVAVTAVDTAANVAGNAMTLNIAGTVSAAAHGIYNTLQATMPQLETGGTNGSFIGAYTELHLITQYFHIVAEDIAHKGRPLCQIRTINTLAGYIMCADGEFDISCTETERATIRDMLTSGFFWE